MTRNDKKDVRGGAGGGEGPSRFLELELFS
jgi:hypothetical protein